MSPVQRAHSCQTTKITTLAPRHVCASAPHMAPEILPQLAPCNVDSVETSPMVLTIGSDTLIPLLGPKGWAYPLVLRVDLQQILSTGSWIKTITKSTSWSHKLTAHCIIGRKWCFLVQVIKTVDKAFYLVGKATNGMGLTPEIKFKWSW